MQENVYVMYMCRLKSFEKYLNIFEFIFLKYPL